MRSGRQKSGREKCWLSCLIYTFFWTSESALPVLSQKAAGIRSGTASTIITARFCLSATAMQDVSSLPPLPINAANQQILHINPTSRVLISAARAILLISPSQTCSLAVPAYHQHLPLSQANLTTLRFHKLRIRQTCAYLVSQQQQKSDNNIGHLTGFEPGEV